MSESKRQKALFGDGNIPPGGTCLSSFVVMTTGPDDVLVGKMAKPEIWVDRFFVGPQWAETYSKSGKYLLPSSHLAWYESPEEAAERVVREQTQLDVPSGSLKLLDVQSHLSGDPNSTEPPHWDICFVYEGRIPSKTAKQLASPEWFEGLGFIKRSNLKADDFTRGHGDVLERAGAIGNKSKDEARNKKKSIARAKPGAKKKKNKKRKR